MTKSSTSTQGITLKALIESGLGMAIHAKNAATDQVAWPDLTFHFIRQPTRLEAWCNPASDVTLSTHMMGCGRHDRLDTNFLDHGNQLGSDSNNFNKSVFRPINTCVKCY